MNNTACTFFGHRDTPKEIEPTLRSTLINLIENKNVSTFYVGNNGNFDLMVRQQLASLSELYAIKYSIVLAYLPKQAFPDNESSKTIYPEGIEKVFPRFAISWRNKWMLSKSDFVVTYVNRPFSGAAQFKELAHKQHKQVINLA